MKNSEPISASKENSLLAQLNRTPPFYIYYQAGHGRTGYHPRIEGIAKLSGLSTSTVERLSRRMDWSDVTLDTLERFCRACGVSFIKVTHDGKNYDEKIFLKHPYRQYMLEIAKGGTKNPFRHLSKQQKENFSKRCSEWATLQAAPSP